MRQDADSQAGIGIRGIRLPCSLPCKDTQKDRNMEKKTSNKDKQALIIKEYVQWLKLEKSLSANTVEAYQQDLQKLLDFLRSEEKNFLDVTLNDLQAFSAGLHDIGIHPRSQARIL